MRRTPYRRRPKRCLPRYCWRVFSDEVQAQRLAEQPHVENEVRSDAGEAADLRGLLGIQRNCDVSRHVAADRREFQCVAVVRQTPARAACAELRKKHLIVLVVVHEIPGRCADGPHHEGGLAANSLIILKDLPHCSEATDIRAHKTLTIRMGFVFKLLLRHICVRSSRKRIEIVSESNQNRFRIAAPAGFVRAPVRRESFPRQGQTRMPPQLVSR